MMELGKTEITQLDRENSATTVCPPPESVQGFTLIETLMAMFVLTFGLLAAGQMMAVSLKSMSLARSKGNAMTVAQNKLEYLADLYRQNSSASDLTTGAHGPEQVQITNPSDNTIMNRFNVDWTVSIVSDPRAGKVLSAKQITVTITPIRSTGTTTNSQRGLNKIISVSEIVSPRTT